MKSVADFVQSYSYFSNYFILFYIYIHNYIIYLFTLFYFLLPPSPLLYIYTPLAIHYVTGFFYTLRLLTFSPYQNLHRQATPTSFVTASSIRQ